MGWLTEPHNSLPVEEAKLYFYLLGSLLVLKIRIDIGVLIGKKAHQFLQMHGGSHRKMKTERSGKSSMLIHQVEQRQ